ncbi:MAG TPA: TadE/TadG family type IV pilus assembly protein [Blastocatellia bacterium]|nr:TadE/TadG family type IV pilus assembly protein [Blastocatellia bacterium]
MTRSLNKIRWNRKAIRSTEHGAQLVELAIVLPIFLLLLAATAEFGNYFYTYVTLTRATRVAARHLSARVYTDTEKDAAKNLAVCGSTASCSSGSEILTGLTTNNVQITNTGNNTLPTTVTVQIVNYTYTPVFDLSRFVGGATWANVAAAPSTTMRYMLWR